MQVHTYLPVWNISVFELGPAWPQSRESRPVLRGVRTSGHRRTPDIWSSPRSRHRWRIWKSKQSILKPQSVAYYGIFRFSLKLTILCMMWLCLDNWLWSLYPRNGKREKCFAQADNRGKLCMKKRRQNTRAWADLLINCGNFMSSIY